MGDVSQHLARSYGTRARDVLQYAETSDKVFTSPEKLCKPEASGHPYLEAEVRYATLHEFACKPCDVLCRRTRLAFVDARAAHEALPRVVQIMGDCLGWDDLKRKQEFKESEDLL